MQVWALVLCAGSLLGTTCEPKKVDLEGREVFVVAGQSNAVGQGESLSEAAGNSWSFTDTGFWKRTADPLHTQGYGSPWPFLADFWEDLAGMPTAFIATAAGGTGLVAPPHWQGILWSMAVFNVSAADASDRVSAVLWMQGETDAANGVSYEEYLAALLELADRAEAQFGAPLVVGVISGYISNAGVPAIQLAQRDSVAMHDNICSGPDTTLLGPLPDGVHFSTDEQIEKLARLWYLALEACLGTPRACSDGQDNDGDGFVDLEDPQCYGYQDPTEAGSACGVGAELVLALSALSWLRGRRKTRS